jgi:hypothetical protein
MTKTTTYRLSDDDVPKIPMPIAYDIITNPENHFDLIYKTPNLSKMSPRQLEKYNIAKALCNETQKAQKSKE